MAVKKRAAHVEKVRLAGIARRIAEGDGPLLSRNIVRKAGAALGRVDRLAPFDLEVDGRRIRIEPKKNLRIEPWFQTSMRWEQLEEDDVLAELRTVAVAPDAAVTLRRAEIVDGDPVVVDGEVLDAEIGMATFRTAGERRITAVAATALASGEHAADLLDNPPMEPLEVEATPPRRRRPDLFRSLTWLLPPAAVLLGALAWGASGSPITVHLASLACAALGSFAYLACASKAPRFVSGGQPVTKLGDDLRGIWAGFSGVLVTILTLVTILDLSGVSKSTSFLAAVMTVLYLLVLGAALHQGTSDGARLLRTLLSAPPIGDGPVEGAWRSAEGTVADPTPTRIAGGKQALAHVVERERREGSESDRVVERIVADGTFFVVMKDRRVEIDPRRATWASEVRVEEETDEPKKTSVVDVVPIGGSILVAGRATKKQGERIARFAGAGKESLVLYASRRGTSARARARLWLVQRYVALAVVLACAVATSTLALSP